MNVELQKVANTKELANDSTKKRNIDLESKIKLLEGKIKEMEEQAGAELCQAQVKLERAKVAVARNKLRAYLL